jgi:twitching motility protein PilT
MDVRELLQRAAQSGASDLHLRAGARPALRVHGHLTTLQDHSPLSAADTIEAFQQVTNDALKTRFAAQRELDFSYGISGLGRFRINACVQRGSISLAFRRLASTIPSIDDLKLPPICKELASRPRGMLLVTGSAGMGKSTSLAAMIDHINQYQARLIITIEDPIEYLHSDRVSMISQREVGSDTHSFAKAIRSALRQDVDVIMVGEMRDLETMSACMTAAETGHLVFSTLHTSSAPMTIDRIVDAFPAHQQNQIRLQLSMSLIAVLAQILVPSAAGDDRVPAVEVMICNDAVRNLIREGKTHQLSNVIQTGSSEQMQTLDQSLRGLYRQGLISVEAAMAASNDERILRTLLEAG